MRGSKDRQGSVQGKILRTLAASPTQHKPLTTSRHIPFRNSLLLLSVARTEPIVLWPTGGESPGKQVVAGLPLRESNLRYVLYRDPPRCSLPIGPTGCWQCGETPSSGLIPSLQNKKSTELSIRKGIPFLRRVLEIAQGFELQASKPACVSNRLPLSRKPSRFTMSRSSKIPTCCDPARRFQGCS